MSLEQHIIKEIFDAIGDLDEARTQELVQKAIASNVDPTSILEHGIVAGVRRIGDQFEEGECFLPELVRAGDIAEESIRLLVPHLPKGGQESARKVVIATVKGDLHNIGKNLVSLMLRINGFSVHDLGIDVPTMKIIETAEELHADIIALSSLMAVTMTEQRELIKYLSDMGLRSKYKVIIGGGPTTKEFADSIGADGWAKTATEAPKVAVQLVGSMKGS